MGIYVNPDAGRFIIDRNDRLYVDKSELIACLNEKIDTKERFICVSRPRRFGKSMAANMIAAYYSKGAADARPLLSELKIGSDPSFERYLNKLNVIKFDMNAVYRRAVGGLMIPDVVNMLVVPEIRSSFPDVYIPEGADLSLAIQMVYASRKEKFVIIIDEYDVPVRDQTDAESFRRYLDLLILLFKNDEVSPAIALAYMTGILPVIRDRVQSKLNSFTEYTMLDADAMAPFMGFTEEETKGLAEQSGMDYGELKRWYDGYSINGRDIYSPKSVVTAASRRRCDYYWTQTGSYDALRDYILMNFEGIRDDVVSMISGARVHANVLTYMNTMDSFRSKDDVFTYLIHLGYLSYDMYSKECFIPNSEVRTEWVNSISSAPDYRRVMEMVNGSRQLLEATWEMDGEAVAEAVGRTHMLVTSSLTYNNEGSFQSAIRLAYFYSDSCYTLFNELPGGKGYADVAFIPFVEGKPALIVELKRDRSAEEAVAQIREREYPAALEKYRDSMLLVGISYDSETKEHSCIIEKA